MTSALARAAHFTADRAGRFWRVICRHPWLTLSLFPLAALGLVVFYVMSLVPFTPSVADLRKAKQEHPSVVLSSDGQPLAELKRANRKWVALAEMSPLIPQALLATEDHRFYEHRGIDLRRTAAAAINTATGKLQGGSTLTQQLARNLYPEEIGRATNLTRKIKEAITALKIESVYTKDEILETYLNTVPFLYNAYGIEMAARTYFDKPARDLDVLEAATLVGMLKGTSYYNPVINPDRAVQRRNIVLAQLVKHGKLQEAQFAQLKARPLRLDFERQEEQLGPAPHFAQQLRRWLIDWADRNGYNVYADGLVVRTTIDSRMQALAVQAVTRHADRLQQSANAAWGPRTGWGNNRPLVDSFIRESTEYQSARATGLTEAQAIARLREDEAFMQSLRDSKTRLQAGFLAIEPATGLVRAWVGSRDFTQDQFDHVQQARRQPGSTFKPFVYGAAFAQGARANDVLIDEVIGFRTSDGKVWQPRDASEPTGQPMTLRQGLALSKNTITAQLTQGLGPARIAQLAQAMGVRDSKLEHVLSLGLGTSPVTLKEMVASYGTIANGGNYVAPSTVLRIEDRSGQILEAFQPAPAEPALSNEAALVLLDAMRGVINEGTATALRGRYGLQGDLAGKTGTTQDNTDGWFILMHPQLVAGAWVGFNDNRITMQDAWGPGARSALPMVGEFYQQALRARMLDAKARFAPPPPQAPGPGPGGFFDPLIGQVNDWLGGLFPARNAPPPAVALPEPPRGESSEPPSAPAIVIAPPRDESSWPRASAPAVVMGPRSGDAAYGVPNPRPGETAIVITPPAGQGPTDVQRAIVVAPPRDRSNGPGVSGEASGAGPTYRIEN
jgi:penicillin-binding protein 1A